MAIKAVPGYTGSGWSYGGKTYKPLPQKTVLQPARANVSAGVPGSLQGLGGQSNAAANLNYKPAAAPGTGAGVTTVTQTPNQFYESDILSAPESQGALTSYTARTNTGMQALRDAIAGNVVSKGWDPGAQLAANPSLAGYANLITQATRDQAAANPLSDKAQLQKSLSEGLYQMPYQLAATGSQRSGAANINATKLNQQYDVASNQSLNDLLAAIKGNVGDYASLASDAASQLNQARAQAAARLASQMGYSTMTTTTGEDLGGGGDVVGGQGGYTGAGPTSMAAVAQALKKPGAVNAMGGPAAWANALSNTVKPKTATQIKKVKAAMLVGRDY